MSSMISKKVCILREKLTFLKRGLFKLCTLLVLILFVSPLQATSGPIKCSSTSGAKALDVQLSDGVVLSLPSISKVELENIYRQLTKLTAAFINEPVSIAWGNPGGTYGPCADKANIIRYFLATGKKHLPEFGFLEGDRVAKELETSTPKIAPSLMISLYALEGMRFSYEFVKPFGTTYASTGVRGKISWGSHKAVVVNVEGELTVIDPLLEEPLNIQKWIRTYVKRTREVPYLSKEQGKKLSVAIYEPRFRESLDGVEIGYTLLPEYSLRTANALNLSSTWRKQFQKSNPFSSEVMSDTSINQLIHDLRLRVKRRM
ncbi:MAG: hypothetical protein VX642_05450 [Bdellovibrionota bacterium]|nr:hypothetical protein [Bdellovibrionota bacterium]